MKNEDSTEGKLNAMMRATANKSSDVWPKNIFFSISFISCQESAVHFSPGELEKSL